MSKPSARTATKVRISPQIIDPSEFEARIRELLANVDTEVIDLDPPARRSGPHPYVEAARRADLLHDLWGTIVQPGVPAATGLRGHARRLVQRATHKATRWYVEQRWAAQHELDAEIARFATDSVLATRRTFLELRDARQEVDSLRREAEALRRSLGRIRSDHDALALLQMQDSAAATSHADQLQSDLASNAQRVAALATDQDRLRHLLAGRAPAADVAKLRDETAGLMQRLGVASARGADFDYVAFENRFRGDSAQLGKTQQEYVSKFPGAHEVGTIVDVGCGRGEMLEVLQAAGHEVLGIELDDNMIEVCRSKGLPVVKADGGSWLEECPAGTLKGVFSAQVIEHLMTPEIERFLHSSLSALRENGVLVIETINPRSLHALANHFFADVSHVRPIHPETLRFMCEQTGFADVALVELSPHPAVAAAGELGTGPTDLAVRELVASVFGFQDYAIVATKRSAA